MEGSSSTADLQRRLVFDVADQRHAIDASRVLEVIRPPHMTRVPHAPAALKGIANLRGRPLPVLSIARILNGSDEAPPGAGKIIVYDHGGAIGLLVDDVLRLSNDTAAAPLHGLDERIDAAFKIAQRAPVERAGRLGPDEARQAAVELKPLLAFRVEGQLYGLPLDHVREVATLSGDVTIIQNATEAVIGLQPMRDRLLPLVSLALLMGLNVSPPKDEVSRIVVIEHQGDLVGLIVDEMDVIRRLPSQAIDAVPAVLQKGRGEGQIEAIGRIAESGLLISILSPEKLFGHQAVAQAVSRNTGTETMKAIETADAVEQFLIFQLGEENYGLPIASVDEVIRVPGEVTRIPGAPAFVMGVINLRGKAVPLIDQRSRFEAPGSRQTTKARAIIVTVETLQAGFVVDAVSEVKAVPAASLSAAPQFPSDETEVFDRIAHLEADGTMILLVDPQELLSRAERDMVAAIARDNTGGG